MTDDVELMSIDEAAGILGFTKLYVRTLVRKGKLRTKKIKLGPASKVWKHMIVGDDVRNFVKRSTRSSNREDGRHKNTLYATDIELIRIRALLEENGFGDVSELIVRPAQTSAYKRRKQKSVAKLLEGQTK